MKRNKVLPKVVKFKHEQLFYKHAFKLLAFLYPDATIIDETITFKDSCYKGISIRITSSSLDPLLSSSFRNENTKFIKSGFIKLEEINTPFGWTGSTGKCYMYPWDRDMFQDSELGMEQKAYYFIVVIQVLLKFLKPE
jgi:hypothetical protein